LKEEKTMPSIQRGQVYKLSGSSWAYRYRDAQGRRRQIGGFSKKGEASEALRDALDEVRLGPLAASRREWTVTQLVERYLEQHQVEPWTLEVLRWKFGKVTDAFGDVKLRELLPEEIGAWRMRIPDGHRFETTQAFRQLLDAAVRWKLIAENPAKLIPNPQPKRLEISPFASWDEVEAVADELGPWGAVPIVAAGTGLRPEELFALEWKDIDRHASVLHVSRAFTRGRLKQWGKTERSRRRVPLRDRVLEALSDLPRRIDVPRIFSSPRGGYVDLHNFRAREWIPAVKAAGFVDENKRATKRLYDLRHSYATMSLAAGVSLFSLSRRMGTSVKMIDRTYGHLAPDAEAVELALLNAYDDATRAEPARALLD
jgi:integrase